MGIKQYDLRVISKIAGIDVKAVAKNNDNLQVFYKNLKSFADLSPGFVTYLRDSSNYRNASSFASGVVVLKEELKNIGSFAYIYSVTLLENAVKNRNTDTRDDLVSQIAPLIEMIGNSIRSTPLVDILDFPGAPTTLSGAVQYMESYVPVKKTVLMIDDMPDVLNSVESILSQEYKFFALQNSNLLGRFLLKNKIDLFILDIEIPGEDGYSIFQQIREQPAYANTPIMFLSGNATPDNLKQAMEIGVNAFVKKPFNSTALLKRVQELMEQQ